MTLKKLVKSMKLKPILSTIKKECSFQIMQMSESLIVLPFANKIIIKN